MSTSAAAIIGVWVFATGALATRHVSAGWTWVFIAIAGVTTWRLT